MVLAGSILVADKKCACGGIERSESNLTPAMCETNLNNYFINRNIPGGVSRERECRLQVDLINILVAVEPSGDYNLLQ